MAKKTKQTKRAKRKSSKPLVTVEPDCEAQFELTDAVSKEPETVRRLAHRAVDLLADAGHYERLGQSVSIHLGYLVDSFVIEKITDLIADARAAGRESSRG